MQTGTRARHWLPGTRPGTGTDKEKIGQRGGDGEFERVIGWREIKENMRENRETRAYRES